MKREFGISQIFFKPGSRKFLGIAESTKLSSVKDDTSYVSFTCQIGLDGLFGRGTGISNKYARTSKYRRNISDFYDAKQSKRGWRDINIKHFYDTATISVGVTDGGIMHTSATGHVFEYEDLFNALHILGYDPLLPIREKKVADKVISKMSKSLTKSALNGETKRSTITPLKAIGETLKSYVVEYIYGGNKPALEKKTISVRRYKEEHGLASYPGKRGIHEPLVETGELLNAISVYVEVRESPEMRRAVMYWANMEKKLEKRRQKISVTQDRLEKQTQRINDEIDAARYRRALEEQKKARAEKKRLEAEAKEAAKYIVLPSGFFSGIKILRKNMLLDMTEDMAKDISKRWITQVSLRLRYGKKESDISLTKAEKTLLEAAQAFIKSRGILLED